ncbi:coiled-coil domain-containing protein 33 isoform X2 [Cottoperca gobio]|uniref:Coiled-coil domain-containing protein 33 isoform X2 n=1 Tax=Cottoperca gobio TaxID=56716 RepID=A0A6J2PY53_COTGO|nr:coiled-coil domain-containing protein 33-like isoform X2 [Cottoperca gobio]
MKASKKTKSLSNPAAIKDGYNLPSHDALAQILPNGRYPFKEARTELHRAAQQEQERPAERPEATQANKPNINHTYQVHHAHKRPPLLDFEDDPHMAEITDLQTKEVENYRSAMSKMAEDIIVLRRRVITLEAENSQLRTDLSLQLDIGRHLLDDTDIDVMTKAEIADRIASLKFKLASETSKAASQRGRIQQLQNDLIKKNDREKELLKLQRVLQQQQEKMKRHQSRLAKMATLEATVKHQEKVIEKMEKAFVSKLREKNKQSSDKRLVGKKQKGETDHREEEIESALAAENTRLRRELDRIHQQLVPVIIQQSAQLLENSKLWGRQKQEMLTH